jgi:hypothetical protein
MASHGPHGRADRDPIDAGQVRRVVTGAEWNAGRLERWRVGRRQVGVAAIHDRSGTVQQEGHTRRS